MPPSDPSVELSPGSPSAESAARCRHFGVCGGCANQDVVYEEQLAAKEALLRETLGAHAARLKPIVPSASPWYYRNKMEFAFGFDKTAVALGLRRRGKFFGVVNLTECHLMTPAAGAILEATRAWASTRELKPYHLRRHQGLLRYLVLREGKRTGQLLAIVVTASPEQPAAFEEALDDLAGRLTPLGVTSLLWAVTDRQADLAVGEVRRTVVGQPRFEERLADVSFSLSPYAFFQPNVELAEKVAVRAREMLGNGWAMLVDLYCGVGGLSLALAGSAERVIGVELEPAAVEDARINAERNRAGHCQFVAEDSLTFLRRFSNYSFLSDKWAVILDPPRSGMHPKMTQQVLRVAPPVILYVSCNPKKLAEDLGAFGRDYELDEATPYDFFPHTPHVEVLARLTRR